MAEEFRVLQPGELAHVIEAAGNRPLARHAGFTTDIAERLTDVDMWVANRLSDLRELLAKEGPARHRAERIRLLERGRAPRRDGMAPYPSAGCTPGERAHIAERSTYVRLTTTTDEQRERKLANLAWLVDRRQRVHRLGRGAGGDRADRRLRYRQLSIASHHGEAYEQWKDEQDRRRAEAAGGSPRERALQWLAEHRGLTEQPPGSNSDSRQDGIRAAQIRCAAGGRWLIGQPWCGVWCFAALQAAGVPGITSRMASVAFIEDDARRATGPFRGWTTDHRKVLPGDLVVLFGRGTHVEVVRRANPDGSVIADGGNTSPGTAGSQANGGGSFLRTRPAAAVHGFALVDYPDR